MSKIAPSTRWKSYEGWDYNGMKSRLEALLSKLDKEVLLQHAEFITGQKFSMSEPFSAGQYWVCFEMVSKDGSLIIARVRLPRHPEAQSTVTEEDELYSIACEVSTMRFVRQKLSTVVVPEVYAYEGPGSRFAIASGAIYMLLEGFYGNTLYDVAPDLCTLSVANQEHIMSQWTMVQASLATLMYSEIGSISSVTEKGEPVIGKLSTAAAEGLVPQGPFRNAVDYFIALGEAAFRRASSSDEDSSYFRLGALVFIDIIQTTTLFHSSRAHYPLNHMDLGTQNLLVDDDFNFLAIIDWEFAQTAPWQVNHYPMPFPLLWPDEKIQGILEDAQHLAHKNVSRQAFARQLYYEKFREAEIKLSKDGEELRDTFTKILQSPASRIYACFSRLSGSPKQDADLVHEMVRLAFGLDADRIKSYLDHVVHEVVRHQSN